MLSFLCDCKDPHRHKIRVTVRLQQYQQSSVQPGYNCAVRLLCKGILRMNESKILKNISEVMHFTTVFPEGGTLPIDVGRIHSQDSSIDWITAFH